jgi:hypothetical protein
VGRTRAHVKEGPHMTSTTFRTRARRLLGRINDYTLWAFNPQPELTSRYDRAA